MNLSPTVRWILGGVAAGVAAFGALLPTITGVPDWVGVLVAVLGAVFAALGIIPPQVGGTQQGLVNPGVSEPPAADINEAPGPLRGEAGQAGPTTVILWALAVIVVVVAVLFLMRLV